MPKAISLIFLVPALLNVGACKYQKKYKYTIRDVYGKVVKQVKVNYELECSVYLLGI